MENSTLRKLFKETTWLPGLSHNQMMNNNKQQVRHLLSAELIYNSFSKLVGVVSSNLGALSGLSNIWPKEIVFCHQKPTVNIHKTSPSYLVQYQRYSSSTEIHYYKILKEIKWNRGEAWFLKHLHANSYGWFPQTLP